MSECACSCFLLGPDTARGSSAACDRGTYRAGIAKMKTMRERIAIQKHFMRNTLERFLFFSQAFGVRTSPGLAFLAYDPNDCLPRKN
jgi:hypothetical protein